MEKIILGRTGLKVSVAGLGAGGHSRLGIAKYGLNHASKIVRTAFDNGVTFFDTATMYGTEEAVGLGLDGISRDEYVLSTKFPYGGGEGIRSPQELERTLNESLKLLKTEYIDIYNLHGVRVEDYRRAVEILLPTMKKAQRDGKIRYLGITEQFGGDTSHEMLKEALPENIFDVVMVGYNIINPSAVKTVLPETLKRNIGVLCMFAVRTALSNPEQLKIDIERIINHKQADESLADSENALDFLMADGVANSIMEAAYRFCRHTKGIDVTLTGTSSIEHLLENLRAIQMPVLPKDVLVRLDKMFGNSDCVSGQ